MEQEKKSPRSEAEVNALIEANLRLVLKIANDFIGRGLSWDDLVSEGNRGLMTAARRYDPAKGARFSTYSAWWIKQAIRQALAEQTRTIRVPIGTQMNLRKIRRAVKTLTESLGRDPSDEEVARKANLPLLTVTRLRRNSTADTQSLNAPVSDADPDGGEFINFVSDDASPAPDQEMVQLEDIEQLLALLGTLSERERKVIQYRFGLDGEPVRTLDEVGAMLHCTNERVRQIQNQALRRLQREMERNQ
ncbi:RNA polymerase sigma factor RpoD/SigA [uncultured Victivallis sp.]|uniref:sigma-70 family RNA polymerase sigma factor n=1 Tax=Victivallis sp. TaxID=2049020 RepID=UPI0025D46254|nr:RNA polymerase sigma factor RpoD/SigA [uncultured Victivallis sp.]